MDSYIDFQEANRQQILKEIRIIRIESWKDRERERSEVSYVVSLQPLPYSLSFYEDLVEIDKE